MSTQSNDIQVQGDLAFYYHLEIALLARLPGQPLSRDLLELVRNRAQRVFAFAVSDKTVPGVTDVEAVRAHLCCEMHLEPFYLRDWSTADSGKL